MEGDAVGLEAEADRELDERSREVGVGAEFLESGQSAPIPSVRRRKKTLEPGAARAILSRSEGESVTKRRTPFS